MRQFDTGESRRRAVEFCFHHNRDVVEAGVVERWRFEDRSRIVGAAVKVGADLKSAVPQLNAAVNAGRQHRAGEPVVAQDPGRERPCGAYQEHDGAHQPLMRSPLEHRIRGEQQRNQNQVGTKLRCETGQQTRHGECLPALSMARGAENHERRHEDHGADRVRGLRRGVDGVERDEPRDDRGDDRGGTIGPLERHPVGQPRHRGIQQNLREQQHPRAIAEHAIERRREVRIPPRHFHGRERLAGRERERQLMVVIETLPSPWMGRPDEHEERSEGERRRACGVDSCHPAASYR